MRKVRLLSPLFFLGAVVFAAGCVSSSPDRDRGEADDRDTSAVERSGTTTGAGMSPAASVDRTRPAHGHWLSGTPDDTLVSHGPDRASGNITISEEWFARFGLLGFVYETAIDNQPGVIFGLGKRMGDNGWFLEGLVTVPRAELEPYSEPNVTDSGRIWIYTLNLGKEFALGDGDRFRWRVHGGLGFFNANSITDNDAGYATTVGAAFQARVWRDVWGSIGVSHYGMHTSVGRASSEYRHHGSIDLSVVVDF